MKIKYLIYLAIIGIAYYIYRDWFFVTVVIGAYPKTFYGTLILFFIIWIISKLSSEEYQEYERSKQAELKKRKINSHLIGTTVLCDDCSGDGRVKISMLAYGENIDVRNPDPNSSERTIRVCSKCYGYGRLEIETSESVFCTRCNGTGNSKEKRVIEYDGVHPIYEEYTKTCPSCHGKKRYNSNTYKPIKILR